MNQSARRDGRHDVSVTASAKHEQVYETKADKQDPNNVDHAPLHKVGQYYENKRYGKIALAGLSINNNQIFAEGGVTTVVNWAKVCTNTPHTEQQRINSASDYNLDKVSNPYTYLKVQYTVENKAKHAITFGGVRELTLSNGTSLNGNDVNVIDDGQSETIQPGQHKVFTIHALIDEFTSKARPRKIYLAFNKSKDTTTLNTVAKRFACEIRMNYK